MKLVLGNEIVPLVNGDDAYPSMLEAIETARTTVGMSSYQFDSDKVGESFLGALDRAQKRGVQVRLLLDSLGIQLVRPPITRALKGSGVRFGTFNPLHSFRGINFRYHRKLLIVDGSIAFTGGLNIRRDHLVAEQPKRPTEDLHFKIRGPVVSQLQDVFRNDWRMTTGEDLSIEEWRSLSPPVGPVTARAVMNGPNSLGEIRSLLICAFRSARVSIRILSPYFIPDEELILVLMNAAKQGVVVEVVVPFRAPSWAKLAAARNFLRIVEAGGQVTWSMGNFDHSKLTLIDEEWSFIGSANMDCRSLRLNAELNVECWNLDLASRLRLISNQKVASGMSVSAGEMRELLRRTVFRRGILEFLAPQL